MKKFLVLLLAVVTAISFAPISSVGTVQAQAAEEDSFDTAWFGANVLVYGKGYKDTYFASGEEAPDRLVFHWTLAANDLLSSTATMTREEFLTKYVDKTFVTHSDLKGYLYNYDGDGFVYDADTDSITLEPGGGGGDPLTLECYQDQTVNGTGTIYCRWYDTEEEYYPYDAVIVLKDGAIERFMQVYSYYGNEYIAKEGEQVTLEPPVIYDNDGNEIDTSSYDIKWYKISWLSDGYDREEIVNAGRSPAVTVSADQYAYYTCEFWKDGKIVPEFHEGSLGAVDTEAWYTIINSSYQEDQTAADISHIKLSYDPVPSNGKLGDLKVTGEARYDVSVILFGSDMVTYPADTPISDETSGAIVILRVVPKDGYRIVTDPEPTGMVNNQKLMYYGDQSEYGQYSDPESQKYPNAHYFAFDGIDVEDIEDLYQYSINADKTAAIDMYTGSNPIVSIPEELNGYPVTSIKSYAFHGNKVITEVTIPGTISEVPGGAFKECSNLKKVTLEKGVTQIGSQAFARNPELSEVKLPDGLISIGSQAFLFGNPVFGEDGAKSKLKSLKIPKSVTSIGDHAVGVYFDGEDNDLTVPGFVVYGASNSEAKTYADKYGLTFISIPGWNKKGNDWYYYNADGIMLKNTWQKDSKGWCYLGASGKMAINSWAKDSKGWCYLGSDGYMVTNSWQKDSKGWCYVGSDGHMVTNGWAKDSKGWCWMGADGYWVSNKWIQSGGQWYYIKSNHYMAANEWAKDAGGWMWMDANGKITKNKWIKSGGYWYYLKSNGYMATGTLKISGKTYKFDSSGRWIS